MLRIGLATLVVATAATWLATPWVIRFARVVGAVDQPDPRKIHRQPIPRVGGAAVVFGFTAGVLFAAWASGFKVPTYEGIAGIYWPGLGIAAVWIFLIGFIDDVRRLSFRWKLAGQIVAGVAVWLWGFRIEFVTNPFGSGVIDLGPLALPLTLLWIVGITNAVNLIDGLDGLASGVALIVTLTMGLLAGLQGKLGVTAACVALAGSLLGFLRFNFNPARIFLGDSGSMFLGFVLAVASIRASHKGPAAVALLAPLLLLGLPILDTGLAIVRRLWRVAFGVRENVHERRISRILRNGHHVFLPDREHIHHKLLDLGLSHRASVLVLYGVTLVLSLDALAVTMNKGLAIVLIPLGVLALMFTSYLILVRGTSRGDAAEQASGGDAERHDKLAPAGADRR
jgi:UDP-GlcNAc:undecaprenyl-phosphate GlcNAc-1-phosphate transferase